MHSIEIESRAALPGQPGDVASVSGDTVTHNGQVFDLSAIPEGGLAMPEGDHPFAGPITRKDGVLRYSLRMAYDTATAEPNQPTDPEHWQVAITSGGLPDLVLRRPVQEETA